jgi:hypothetical protein
MIIELDDDEDGAEQIDTDDLANADEDMLRKVIVKMEEEYDRLDQMFDMRTAALAECGITTSDTGGVSILDRERFARWRAEEEADIRGKSETGTKE